MAKQQQDKIVIDPMGMTLGDIAFFEEYTGEKLEQLQDGSPSAKALIALVYLTKRRENPTYTLEDAMETPLTALEQEGEDPTPAADAKAAS